MSPEEIVKYLNERYTVNGAFYWKLREYHTEYNRFLKMVPSSQRHAWNKDLRSFGIGALCFGIQPESFCFRFYRGDVKDFYGYVADDIEFTGDTVDEVMNAVVSYIIVNGMCDLRHKDLT